MPLQDSIPGHSMYGILTKSTFATKTTQMYVNMPYIEHLGLREVPVLLQNRNGPCALLAIANGLLFLCPQDTVGRVVANLGYPVCCFFVFSWLCSKLQGTEKGKARVFVVCLVRIYIYILYLYIYILYIYRNIYIYAVYLCVYIYIYLYIYTIKLIWLTSNILLVHRNGEICTFFLGSTII